MYLFIAFYVAIQIKELKILLQNKSYHYGAAVALYLINAYTKCK